MPTKRRKLATRAIGISQAAIEAWKSGDFHGLNREIGVRPWQTSPFDADRTQPSDDAVTAWPRAAELRAALIEAAGRPGRVGRHGEPLGSA